MYVRPVCVRFFSMFVEKPFDSLDLRRHILTAKKATSRPECVHRSVHVSSYNNFEPPRYLAVTRWSRNPHAAAFCVSLGPQNPFVHGAIDLKIGPPIPSFAAKQAGKNK